MPSPERPLDYRRSSNEPLQPVALPPELVDFLKDRQFGALFHSSDQGTVVVAKAPLEEIRRIVGPVPIQIRHDLYEHPRSPVIQTRLRIYDDPERPLAFEMFTNVDDEQQRADYAALEQQKELFLLFYDEQVQHRLSKRVATPKNPHIPGILRRAEAYRLSIPDDQFDFDVAKAEVIRRSTP